MLLHFVVLVSLSWPHVTGTGNADQKDEPFDQLATASEKQEFRDQLITSIVDTTVHYENSNGFVPMVASPLPELKQDSALPPLESNNVTSNGQNNSSTVEELDNIEDDPAYSTEARIFLNLPNNRRSFEYQANQNEFELLKVRNNTPVVANYPDTYEDPRSDENDDKTRSRHRTQGKGQKIENYMGNYGTVTPENFHNSPKDNEKKNQEKVTNYHQQRVLNYDGQSKQPRPTVASIPRPNQEISLFLNTKNNDHYDSESSSSQIAKNHRFSRPVVVAEPDYKLDRPSSDEYQNSRVLDSVQSAEAMNRYMMDNRNGRYRSEEDSGDASEDEYVEYTERPRKIQKSRRRPNDSKRLPKEHRGSHDDSTEYEIHGKRHHASRTKSHRHRTRGNSWTNNDDQDQDDSYEDTRQDERLSETRHKSQSSKFKPSPSWNQISPNLEISHSSGIEIGQLEKPKLIVPVNLVRLANFNHATAIGNSQGFDVSNAVLRNIVPAVGNPNDNAVSQDVKVKVSTPVPDVIVGQNNFQNQMYSNDQNKYYKPQYVSSTAAPVLAVAQDGQGMATPRPNQMPQLIVPQPTLQTVPTLMQTPVNLDYIQVNPHGIQGQSAIGGSLQPLPTMSTITPTPINLITAETQNKKMLPGAANTNFLASASLSVGQNEQTNNGDSYYSQDLNNQQNLKQGWYQQMNAPKMKAYIQTHLLPVLQSVPTFATISANGQDQNQQYTGYENNAKPALAYQSIDNAESNGNGNANASPGIISNAHLPHVGTRNVEIVNPNIKPSPVDTIINSYEAMHYPAAVLTTSIPMFTATGFVTARPAVLSPTTEPANVHSFANSLTEIGAKNNQANNDLKAYQSQNRPMFNPINFVPNVEVVRNQDALNSKLHANEPLQQNLNLVPLIPGGNFFKPSFTSHSELYQKPKLSSDLATYAEQMFKESLKTMYNSQKWNNDRNRRQNVTEADVIRLRNELQRLKASLYDSRNKDHEAHHSETNVQTAELPNKKPDPELVAAFEQMLKNHPKEYNFRGKPHRHRRPEKYRETKHIKDFMTPPHQRLKGHHFEKPGKKRPGPRFRNHHHGPRPHHRSNLSPKAGSLEVSGSNIDPVHVEGFPQYETIHDSRQFRKGSYSSASHERNNSPNGKHYKGFDGKESSYNQPKMHNLFGLLMKNKQLPSGNNPNYFRDKDQLKQFLDDEKRRMEQQFFGDTFKDQAYRTGTQGPLYSNLGQASNARRSLPEKRIV
ncbi:uncharacterized protein LOC108625471 [Ceratina calcarata]|uniref:Uncharacterized protein LOC108625471 n=1 Tax=Ceratina calcarata TaxID=156304 RepID=A0AAJ7IZN9_9HYME|nr:uncharacterized protein LOC108625471 [Ceratina calcarata]